MELILLNSAPPYKGEFPGSSPRNTLNSIETFSLKEVSSDEGDDGDEAEEEEEEEEEEEDGDDDEVNWELDRFNSS